MTWVRLDDQFPIHRKVDVLSDAAFRLHVSAICWSARNLTDGFVSARELSTVVRMRKPVRFAAELVSSGVWRPVDGGWQIHDYLDFQPSKEKVDAERRAKTERQRRWRDRQSGRGEPVGKSVDNFRRDDVDASTNASLSTGTNQTHGSVSRVTRQKKGRDASVDASQDAAPYPPRPEGSGARPRATGTASRRGANGRAGPSGPPVRAVPNWCGECDERTRQVDPDKPRRCPVCHPLRGQETA